MNKNLDPNPDSHPHPDLVSLLAAWHTHEGSCDEERARWLSLLREDETLRRQFAAEIHLAGLARAAQAGEPRWLRIEERLEADAESAEDFESAVMASLPRCPARWQVASRSWLAAVAGLLIGLFSASVVFGFVMPRAVATASRLFTLADGSFESRGGPLPPGFPLAFGTWGGDEAEAVGVFGKFRHIPAGDGKQALRFVRAQREPALPNYGAASCDVYQLVDLRPVKAEAASGEASLELSTRFLDARTAPGEAVKFICRLFVFSGTPDSLPSEWPLSQKEALAAGSGNFDSSGGTPVEWHTVTAKVLLPPQADFAVIHLLVHNPKTPAGAEADFGEQFADDVRLTFKTQPALPVRLAQR